MQVRSLGQEDPLEEGTAIHSSILAWRIPWTGEPGGLQSIGSQRVRHDWSNLPCTPYNLLHAWGLAICKGWPLLIITGNKQLFSVIHCNRHVGMGKIISDEILKDQILIQVLSLILQIEKLISIILTNLKIPGKLLY